MAEASESSHGSLWRYRTQLVPLAKALVSPRPSCRWPSPSVAQVAVVVRHKVQRRNGAHYQNLEDQPCARGLNRPGQSLRIGVAQEVRGSGPA
jgi:hypothetical protein